MSFPCKYTEWIVHNFGTKAMFDHRLFEMPRVSMFVLLTSTKRCSCFSFSSSSHFALTPYILLGHRFFSPADQHRFNCDSYKNRWSFPHSRDFSVRSQSYRRAVLTFRVLTFVGQFTNATHSTRSVNAWKHQRQRSAKCDTKWKGALFSFLFSTAYVANNVCGAAATFN